MIPSLQELERRDVHRRSGYLYNILSANEGLGSTLQKNQTLLSTPTRSQSRSGKTRNHLISSYFLRQKRIDKLVDSKQREHRRLRQGEVQLDRKDEEYVYEQSVSKKIVDRWCSNYDVELSCYKSPSIFVEAKLFEIVHEFQQTRVSRRAKAAICCDLLRRLRQVFGRYEAIMTALTRYLLSFIYRELSESDDPAYTAQDYLGLTPYFEDTDEYKHALLRSCTRVLDHKSQIMAARLKCRRLELTHKRWVFNAWRYLHRRMQRLRARIHRRRFFLQWNQTALKQKEQRATAKKTQDRFEKYYAILQGHQVETPRSDLENKPDDFSPPKFSDEKNPLVDKTSSFHRPLPREASVQDYEMRLVLLVLRYLIHNSLHQVSRDTRTCATQTLEDSNEYHASDYAPQAYQKRHTNGSRETGGLLLATVPPLPLEAAINLIPEIYAGVLTMLRAKERLDKHPFTSVVAQVLLIRYDFKSMARKLERGLYRTVSKHHMGQPRFEVFGRLTQQEFVNPLYQGAYTSLDFIQLFFSVLETLFKSPEGIIECMNSKERNISREDILSCIDDHFGSIRKSSPHRIEGMRREIDELPITGSKGTVKDPVDIDQAILFLSNCVAAELNIRCFETMTRVSYILQKAFRDAFTFRKKTNRLRRQLEEIFVFLDEELHPGNAYGVFGFSEFCILLSRCHVVHETESDKVRLFNQWNDQADRDADDFLRRAPSSIYDSVITTFPTHTSGKRSVDDQSRRSSTFSDAIVSRFYSKEFSSEVKKDIELAGVVERRRGQHVAMRAFSRVVYRNVDSSFYDLKEEGEGDGSHAPLMS